MLSVSDFIGSTREACPARKEQKKKTNDLYMAENTKMRVRVVWSKDRGKGGRLTGLLKLLIKDA
jgi:hypothetical protein